MITITIRVSQTPYKNGIGPWQRKVTLAAVPRTGDAVFVDDYSWGDHIGFEGVDVKSVGHSLLTGEIIVDVEDIEERGELYSVDGTTWTEKGSKYWEEGDDENGRERVVLIGFTLCDS